MGLTSRSASRTGINHESDSLLAKKEEATTENPYGHGKATRGAAIFNIVCTIAGTGIVRGVLLIWATLD